MKKKNKVIIRFIFLLLLCFLMIIIVFSFKSYKKNISSSVQNTTYYLKTYKKKVINDKRENKINNKNDLNNRLVENKSDNSEEVQTSSENNVTIKSSTDNQYFQTKDIKGLLQWIKSGNEVSNHFLDYARKKGKIIEVKSKNKNYKLQSIVVDPNHEYIVYTFVQDEKYIDITINLSNSMKENRSKDNKNIDKIMLEYNKKLTKKYLDFQYRKEKKKIENQTVSVFVNDGGYYTLVNGQKKLISPGAFFEIEKFEVEISLYVELKDKQWEDKYIDMFDFNIVEFD